MLQVGPSAWVFDLCYGLWRPLAASIMELGFVPVVRGRPAGSVDLVD